MMLATGSPAPAGAACHGGCCAAVCTCTRWCCCVLRLRALARLPGLAGLDQPPTMIWLMGMKMSFTKKPMNPAGAAAGGGGGRGGPPAAGTAAPRARALPAPRPAHRGACADNRRAPMITKPMAVRTEIRLNSCSARRHHATLSGGWQASAGARWLQEARVAPPPPRPAPPCGLAWCIG